MGRRGWTIDRGSTTGGWTDRKSRKTDIERSPLTVDSLTAIRACVCTYIHTYGRTVHACMHGCACVRACVCLCLCVCVSVCLYLCLCVCCIHLCICASMHLY